MAVTLGEALESARAKGIIYFGEGPVGAVPDAVLLKERKGPDAETPGQVRLTNRLSETPGEATQPANAAASRANGTGIDTATPSRAPQRGVVSRPMLLLIEGGLAEAGGNTPARPIRRASQGGDAAGELKLRVV